MRVGAKVIQRANNYEKNVFNGEIGYITKIGQVIDDKNNNKESVVTVDFGDKTIDFSHSELANLDLEIKSGKSNGEVEFELLLATI